MHYGCLRKWREKGIESLFKKISVTNLRNLSTCRFKKLKELKLGKSKGSLQRKSQLAVEQTSTGGYGTNKNGYSMSRDKGVFSCWLLCFVCFDFSNKMLGRAQSWQNEIPYPADAWWPTNWRATIPKKFSHCCEGSEPLVNLVLSSFTTQGSSQVTRNPQEIWLWRRAGFDCRTCTGLGQTETLLLQGTNKTLCATRPRGEEQWPHRRLNQTYQLGLESFLLRYGLAVAHCWDRDIWSSNSRRCPLARAFLEVTICPTIEPVGSWPTSPQAKQLAKREHRLIHQKTTGSKCNQARPYPSQQDSVFHTTNSSHQFLPQQPEGRQKKRVEL